VENNFDKDIFVNFTLSERFPNAASLRFEEVTSAHDDFHGIAWSQVMRVVYVSARKSLSQCRN